MKRVISKVQEEINTVDKAESDKFYLVVKPNPSSFRDIGFLRFEPTEGWIFRNCDHMVSGHAGHNMTFEGALTNIVKDRIVYQFDSFKEAIIYINSLKLI